MLKYHPFSRSGETFKKFANKNTPERIFLRISAKIKSFIMENGDVIKLEPEVKFYIFYVKIRKNVGAGDFGRVGKAGASENCV